MVCSWRSTTSRRPWSRFTSACTAWRSRSSSAVPTWAGPSPSPRRARWSARGPRSSARSPRCASRPGRTTSWLLTASDCDGQHARHLLHRAAQRSLLRLARRPVDVPADDGRLALGLLGDDRGDLLRRPAGASATASRSSAAPRRAFLMGRWPPGPRLQGLGGELLERAGLGVREDQVRALRLLRLDQQRRCRRARGHASPGRGS